VPHRAFRKGLQKMICHEAIRAFPGFSRIVPLSAFTTWRIGGLCAALFPESPESLADIMKWIGESGVPWSMLGRGSNILAPSAGWNGVVVCLRGSLAEAAFQGETLTAGAGAALPGLAGAACSLGLKGMVFAAGIPGTLGGAVFMNAGAYGECMADIVREVSVVYPGGETRKLTRLDCGFDYRTSVFQQTPGAIYRVVLRLARGNRADLRREAADLLEKRRRSFPVTVPNAGSVFKRPEQGPPPGMLLEQCGMKGFAVGGARFSPVHANFIENTRGADSEDVLALIRAAKRRVLEMTGFQIHEEIRVLGGES